MFILFKKKKKNWLFLENAFRFHSFPTIASSSTPDQAISHLDYFTWHSYFSYPSCSICHTPESIMYASIQLIWIRLPLVFLINLYWISHLEERGRFPSVFPSHIDSKSLQFSPVISFITCYSWSSFLPVSMVKAATCFGTRPVPSPVPVDYVIDL
jgi:hypothetical protein